MCGFLNTPTAIVFLHRAMYSMKRYKVADKLPSLHKLPNYEYFKEQDTLVKAEYVAVQHLLYLFNSGAFAVFSDLHCVPYFKR